MRQTTGMTGLVKVGRRAILAGLIVFALTGTAQAQATTILTEPTIYSTPPAIVDNGGPVQSDPTVFLVFWGSYWTSPVAQAEIQAEQTLFQQIGSSSYLGLLSEYGVRGETYGGTYIDPSDPVNPSTCSVMPCPLRYGDFSDEVTRAQTTLGSPDPAEAQYLIFPQPGANLTAFGSRPAGSSLRAI